MSVELGVGVGLSTPTPTPTPPKLESPLDTTAILEGNMMPVVLPSSERLVTPFVCEGKGKGMEVLVLICHVLVGV